MTEKAAAEQKKKPNKSKYMRKMAVKSSLGKRAKSRPPTKVTLKCLA